MIEPFQIVDSGQDAFGEVGVNMVSGVNNDVKKLTYVRALIAKGKKKVDALIDTGSSSNLLSLCPTIIKGRSSWACKFLLGLLEKLGNKSHEDGEVVRTPLIAKQESNRPEPLAIDVEV